MFSETACQILKWFHRIQVLTLADVPIARFGRNCYRQAALTICEPARQVKFLVCYCQFGFSLSMFILHRLRNKFLQLILISLDSASWELHQYSRRNVWAKEKNPKVETRSRDSNQGPYDWEANTLPHDHRHHTQNVPRVTSLKNVSEILICPWTWLLRMGATWLYEHKQIPKKSFLKLLVRFWNYIIEMFLEWPFSELFLKFWSVNKHGISEWRLLALYRHKEILVNSSENDKKKMARAISKNQMSDPGPSWPSCLKSYSYISPLFWRRLAWQPVFQGCYMW